MGSLRVKNIYPKSYPQVFWTSILSTLKRKKSLEFISKPRCRIMNEGNHGESRNMLNLKTANAICDHIIAAAEARDDLKPMTAVVVDAGGAVIASQREDNASPIRTDLAKGKAHGAVMLGLSSRKLGERAESQAYFIQSMNALCNGSLVPVPGGVLVRDSAGSIIGAVGVTGDTSDKDEALAIAAIEAAGLTADV